MLVIGDVHGCYETLMRLIEKLPKDEEIVFVGDLVDRGPANIKVVDFVKTGKFKCCMGNHEHLMLDHHGDKKCYPYGCWLDNGGDVTDREYMHDEEKLAEHIDWMKGLPSYLEFPELQLNGRHLFVSHAAPYDPDAHEIKLSAMCSLIWNRGEPYKNEDKYCIYGHTPQRELKVGLTHTNIDTGAAYSHRGYGTLSAISFPSLQVFQQNYVG